METLEAIKTRRSVRRFRDKPVDKKSLETILHAGMQAPSANNRQSWEFVVIDDRALLNWISENHPHAKMAAQAPLAILCCHNSVHESEIDFGQQNVSAAIQNMLLAVRDLGLGAVWCGIYPREERVQQFSQKFALPNEVTPISMVVIGHSDVEQTFVDRYDENKIHSNKY